MNIDLLELAIPAATALLGYMVGVARGRRKLPKPVPAVCPCHHAISFHEGGAGICRGTDKRTKYDRFGDFVGYTYDHPCTCQVYAGPELVSSITMQQTSFRQIAAEED